MRIITGLYVDGPPLEDSEEGIMGSQSSPSSHPGSAKLHPSPAGWLNISAVPPPPWLLRLVPLCSRYPTGRQRHQFPEFETFP